MNPIMKNCKDTMNGNAFKKNMNIAPNINETSPIIIERYLYSGMSVKIMPIHIDDIPKQTIEKPIIIEINAEETIGYITSSRPTIMKSSPIIFSIFTLSPPKFVIAYCYVKNIIYYF